MEKDSDGRESPTKFLKQRWNFYQTSSVIQGRHEKLDRFLIEFLKAYSLERGNLATVSTFGDIQSVSNMLVREFQSLILSQCEEDDEQGLITFLCCGRGLLLLQTLSILACKVSGGGRELANLLLTLLPVILRAPLVDYQPHKGLKLVLMECEEYVKNIKGKSFHFSSLREHILHSSSYTSGKSSALQVQEEVDNQGISSGATNCKGTVKDTSETVNSRGVSSIMPLEFDSCLFGDMHLNLSGTVDAFELTLLILAILEDLFLSDNTTLYRNVAADTYMKLLDIVIMLNRSKTSRISKLDNSEIDCKWSISASHAIQIAILRGVFSIAYSCCHKAGSLKALVKSKVVQKTIEVIRHCTNYISFSPDQLKDIFKFIENPDKSRSFENHNSWKEFQLLLFSSLAIQTLVTFLFSNLHRGIIVLPQLQMLTQDLLVQFADTGGFDVVKSSLLKLECIFVQGSDKSLTQSANVVDILQKLKDFPRLSVLRLLSILGRIIFVMKKTRTPCRPFFETGRVTVGEVCPQSSHFVEDYDELYPASSDLDSSQESTGDMEKEQERRSNEREGFKEYCSIIKPVETLLSMFQDSTSEFTKAQLASILARFGVCRCLTPDHLVPPLLAGFSDHSQHVQDVVLQLIAQLILTDIDIPLTNKIAPSVHFHEGKRFRRNSGKFPKSSPSRSDSGFSTGDHVTSCLKSSRQRANTSMKNRIVSWSCLSQYCLLLLTSDDATALRVVSSLEPLVNLGSPCIRVALFRHVILPLIMRFRARERENTRNKDETEDFVFYNIHHPGADRDAENAAVDVSQEGLGLNPNEECVSNTLWKDENKLSYTVLEKCVTFLPRVLSVKRSHSFFRKCGGLHQLRSLFAVKELQHSVVKVFEFLSSLENDFQKGFGFDKVKGEDSLGGLDSDSQEDEEEETVENEGLATKYFIRLLQLSAKFVHNLTKVESSDEKSLLSSASSERTELRGLSLSVHLWKTCLHLVVSNELFGEMFCAEGGVSCSYSLMATLQEYLRHFLTDESLGENKEVLLKKTELKEIVRLYEILLAVCIRFVVVVDIRVNKKGLPSLEKLVTDIRQTYTTSLAVREFLSTGLCDSFFKASLDRDVQEVSFDFTERTSGSKQLRAADHKALQEEWSILLEDDMESNGTSSCKPKRAVEEGYMADTEIQSDSSDASCEPEEGSNASNLWTGKAVKREKGQRQPKLRQRSETAGEMMDQQITGRILYPRVCKIALELLNLACANSTLTEGSHTLFLMCHATRSLSQLLHSYDVNCATLCSEGLLNTILECFHAALENQDKVLETLQMQLLDVVVLLAKQQINANELWDLLTFIKETSPPVNLLCNALATIARFVGKCPRPTFVLSFPCYLENPELCRRSPVTGRKMQGRNKRHLSQSKPRRSSGCFPLLSDKESSSDHNTVAELKYSASDSSEKSPKLEIRNTNVLSTLEKTSKDSKGPKRQSSRLGRDDTPSSKKVPKEQGATDQEEYRVAQKVRAIELPLKGHYEWTRMGFSIAFWIKINSRPKRNANFGASGNDTRNKELQRMFGVKKRVLGFERKPAVLEDKEKNTPRVFHLCSIKSSRNKFEIWVDPSNGAFLLRWTKNSKSNLRRCVVLDQMNLSPRGFSRDTWHHVAVSFKPAIPEVSTTVTQDVSNAQPARILIVVDGKEAMEAEFRSLTYVPLDEHDMVVILGHARVVDPANEMHSFERTQQTSQGGYHMGAVSIFVSNKSKDSEDSEWVVGKDEAFYLFSLGPHCAVIGQLSEDLKLISDEKNGPAQTYIEGCKLWMRMNVSERALSSVKPEFINMPHLTFPDIENALKRCVVATYNPIHHQKFHQYHVPQDRPSMRRHSRDTVASNIELISTSLKAGVPRDLQPIRSSSLLEAAHDVGGISVFIYFFAKVVEIADDEKTQSEALSVLLSIQRRCEYHAKAMDQEAGYTLIKHVLLTPRCQIGYHMLKVLMEAACDGEVFRATNLSDKPIQLNIESNAVVRDIAIFKNFLLDWKVWEKAPSEGEKRQEFNAPLGVWEMLLSTVEILVHSSHAHYKFNVRQFLKADLVQQLLIGCQERHSEKRSEMPGAISSLYVNIIQHIMSSLSPDLTVLKAVCEFLLSIHPTKDTIHLDSPTGFYLAKNVRGYSTARVFPKSSNFPTAPSRVSTNPMQHISRSFPGEQRNLLKRQLGVKEDTASSFADRFQPLEKAVDEFGKAEEELEDERQTLTREHFTSTPDEGEENERTITKTKDPSNNSVSAQNVQPDKKEKTRLSIEIPSRSPLHKSNYCRSVSSDTAEVLLYSPQLHPVGMRSPTKSPLRHGGATPASPISPYYGPRHVSFSGPSSQPVSITQGSTPHDQQSSIDLKDYEYLNDSDFNSLKSSLPHQSSEEYVVVEGIPGLQPVTRTYKLSRTEEQNVLPDNLNELRLGLLKLLQKVIFKLQEELVPAVIGEILKAEYIIVWASHDSSEVRELAVQILFLYLKKAEPAVYEQFLHVRGFHLLANQLHDHPATRGLAEGCLSLLVGRPVDLRKDFNYSVSVDSTLAPNLRCMGVIPVLALLENSFTVQEVFHMMIQHLNQLFIQVDDLFLKAVEHGLLETVCNVAYAICSVQHKQRKEAEDLHINENLLLESLQLFITAIVRKVCSTCGDLYFQLFEELLVALEKLEDQELNSREFAPSIAFCARYLRCFAVQVALQFYQELSKDDGSVNGRKEKKGVRFRVVSSLLGHDQPIFFFSADCAPQSSWVNISNLQKGVTLEQLKRSAAVATVNEQRCRWQKVCQMGVNIIVYSKKFFLPKDFVPFELELVDLRVHESLEGGMVRGVEQGVDVDREFAQFLFSFLVEMLSMGLEVGKRTGLVFSCKDAVKTQLGRLLVYMLNPCQDIELAYFALHLANHPRASDILNNVLTVSSAGTKLRERVALYLWKILDRQQLPEKQKNIAVKFQKLMEYCGFQIYDTDSQESPVRSLEEEVKQWDQTDTENLLQWQRRQAEACKPLMERVDRLCAQVSAAALGVIKVVTEIQDKQRQNLLKHNRNSLSAEVQVRKKWRQINERLIHERAVWYDRAHFQSSWRLDPTEGPSRVRCRLQRCHMDIADKYIMEEYRNSKTRNDSSPLTYLFADSSNQSEKNIGYYVFDTTDTIRFQCRCRNIYPDSNTKGMLLVGDTHVHFVGEEAIADTDITQILLGNKDAVSISWAFEEIQEIHIRRYCLQDNALEIFLTNGRTFLLAFETTEDRKSVLDEFKVKNLPYIGPSQDEHLHIITARWRKGEITNFEYLTELNKTAGRSFNDLMQYPVFPFVLRDFESDILDLNSDSSFRILSRPIAVQDDSRKRKYRETYMWLNEEYEKSNKEDPLKAPYNYGSHYSNSGTVLHFTVRLPPFTKMFLQYQDGSFDIPDRTFHSMATTWRLSSFESSTDVKELIPEFFFLPDFLENIEGFDFGFRQNGQRVMHVTLPPWAEGSRRFFVRINRQALESDYVSKNIHEWIDLVFGFKQTGPEAVEAVNVFHPATYYGVDVNSISDPLQKKALKTMIETYGQTPKQLFYYRHPPKQPVRTFTHSASVSTYPNLTSLYDGQVHEATGSVAAVRTLTSSPEGSLTVSGTERVAGNSETKKDRPRPLSSVQGLKWGNYVGSPDLPPPAVINLKGMKTDIKSLISLKHNQLFALEENSALVTVYWNRPGDGRASDIEEKLWAAVISWGHLDCSLRVSWKGRAGVFLMEHCTPDKVTCCAVANGCKSLFIGSSTGALFVLPIRFNSLKPSQIELLGSRVRLQGHKDVITCLQICHEFSIVVSASRDTIAIIWDLNRLNYVQCMKHETAVTSVAISRTSGDIATVCLLAPSDKKNPPLDMLSYLHLWDVNGRKVSDVTCEHVINAIDFSNAREGISVNVIAAGLSNGTIRLYSAWDLQYLSNVQLDHPIGSENFNPVYNLFSTWDTSQMKEVVQDLHPPAVVAVSFSYDNQRLFAADANGVVTTLQSVNTSYNKPPSPYFIPVAPSSPRIQPKPAASPFQRHRKFSLEKSGS